MATNDALDKIFAQLSKLTTHVTAMAPNIKPLKIENDNRIEEIQKIAKGLGYSTELETDKGQITDDNAKPRRIRRKSGNRKAAY